jgi:glycosyltransferase involved in cell wall biosynthesis
MNNPPRVAFFLATSGHSGVDKVMGRLLPALAGRGFRVDLLRVDNHGPYLPPVEGVRQVRLGARHVATCLGPLFRYLKKESPDVLLADKDKANRLAIIASRLASPGTRVVVRFGATLSQQMKNRSFGQRLTQSLSMRYLYPLAHRVLTPSKGAADDMAAATGLRREHIHVVPSPVITRRFLKLAAEPVEHPWLVNKTMPVFIGIGELSKRKDFSTMIRAFARVRANRPCRLMILGKGKLKAHLEALAEELGVQEDVMLPGFQENPYAYLARADLFLHSARSEGLGLALVEAVALGINAVACDCPSGPGEVLAGGKYGRLVDVGDDEGMASAIMEALAAPVDAAHLTEAAAPYREAASVDSYLAGMGFNTKMELTL